ncbi:GAF domain-containing sensor histidine kinase [Balneolales bacterium ANBcel1]|nr:GAF domain-containing sensor histidine kinase [Balneolales bacterium ANBcel1]
MTHSTWLGEQTPPIPADETQRLEALRRYVGPDGAVERNEALEKLARLASEFFEIPIVLVNLIDEETQYQQACHAFEARTTARSESFCQFTIMSDDVFEVRDARKDPLFRNNPNVTGGMQLRFYAGAPLKTPDGHNIGSLCLIDRKPNALTPSDKQALRTLADEVVSRMELTRLNRVLEEESRAKDELMRIVSHDMRNPLMGIVGFAEYLHQETEDEEKREIYSIMEDAAKHMLGIVNVMLNSDYLRNESFALHRKVMDVAELTRDVIKLYQPFAMIKEQELAVDLPDNLRFKIDPERWKHITGNLISNAVKFTPRHGRVFVSVGVVEGTPRSLVLRVEDTGIGLSEEQLKSLYSGNKSIRRRGTEGEETSGLGMLFIKKSVELHRGTISVTSAPDKGTVFTIEIPE